MPTEPASSIPIRLLSCVGYFVALPLGYYLLLHPFFGTNPPWQSWFDREGSDFVSLVGLAVTSLVVYLTLPGILAGLLNDLSLGKGIPGYIAFCLGALLLYHQESLEGSDAFVTVIICLLPALIGIIPYTLGFLIRWLLKTIFVRSPTHPHA